jgi:hypothetical protein
MIATATERSMRARSDRTNELSHDMKVSLLVAMHNEAGYIERCLASIFA